ncbi:GNAT family acetyltransferase [Streptomyces himastatinicus ATCC 53653]|uniref:GNAT family acetyltransferase n=1 Tax=Streptomyces himastatinicus ATCC 53653 TaxID=457427 RepID=D9WUF0_9ACTN|nr:GNAT family N-acetyltransferase [Streptomyces himastatinicus]EFL24385.1 GNAT family acetyltransferase [Streptomyces himastatinicus ATCC 53653]
MDDGIRVRVASVGEAEAMADIHTRARSAYYLAGGAVEEVSDDAGVCTEREAAWGRAIASAGLTALCVEVRGGGMVGVLAMGAPKDADVDASVYRQLFQIHVHPDFWGRGVGGALHEAFAGRLVAGGFTGGVLEAWEGNPRARGFYARRGWREDGDRRPGPRDVDYVRMRLRVG